MVGASDSTHTTAPPAPAPPAAPAPVPGMDAPRGCRTGCAVIICLIAAILGAAVFGVVRYLPRFKQAPAPPITTPPAAGDAVDGDSVIEDIEPDQVRLPGDGMERPLEPQAPEPLDAATRAELAAEIGEIKDLAAQVMTDEQNREFLRSIPTIAPATVTHLQHHLTMLHFSRLTGDWTMVRATCGTIIALYGPRAEALKFRGLANIQLNAPAAALADLTAAVAADPSLAAELAPQIERLKAASPAAP